ncbi:Uncharacterized protein BM_BM2869 [Brugia malayi]|uniref:Uncharacterized protein n=3 Tax=Brugia TaxID=6278 RepID=A0A4E9FC40_BRUMA|nr:Uncharacterized protein BM_BM2869 [Brugia malayi]VIO94465.1 Uncharacterized protein BM_BM2869 [Brugia malayi]
MPKSLSDDLEEGEIFDSEETVINQSNVNEYSNNGSNERTNLTEKKCFQSLNYGHNGSFHSNNNLKIPDQSAICAESNEDNLEACNDEKEENMLEDIHDYELNDEECFLDHWMIDEDELEDELNVANFQDELVEYHSNSDDDLDDDDDKDSSDFSGKIVCSERITAANKFHTKMKALAMDMESRTNKIAIGDEKEMRTNLAKEMPVDDSWIFHSLDETPRIVMQGNEPMDSYMLSESEGNLKEQLAEMDLSKFEVMIDVTVSGYLNCDDSKTMDVARNKKQMLHEESNSHTKQIVELERKFSEEKEHYVRNMYSLLTTARTQIAALKKENDKLKMKLQANCTMNCPKCKHQICLRNNLLKPKYIKVLKGRCAIEMLFDNLAKMEEWLAANYLDINSDGLPVVLELPQKSTLTSTNSLLALETGRIHDIHRNTSKVMPTSSSLPQKPESIFPVKRGQNIQTVRAASNFSKHSTKQYEKLNHVLQGEKGQERTSSSIAYDFYGKRKKRSHEKKRSGPNKCEEQQLHHILSTYTSPDGSLDRDQRRYFSSPKPYNSHVSHLNTKLNAEKNMTSMSNRQMADQKGQRTTINNLGNRFEYRSPSEEYRRESVKSSAYYRRADEGSYREYWNHSPRPSRIRSVERKL